MIIKFNTKDVQRLLDDSKNAKERRTSFDDPQASPGLWLVGDQGVYLMSNSKQGVLAPDHSPEHPHYFVAYAHGCNPSEDEDWYEIKRHSFGGDDGIVFVSAAQIEPSLVGNSALVEIDLTPEHIGFISYA